jgi:hypothetical protein
MNKTLRQRAQEEILHLVRMYRRNMDPENDEVLGIHPRVAEILVDELVYVAVRLGHQADTVLDGEVTDVGVGE